MTTMPPVLPASGPPLESDKPLPKHELPDLPEDVRKALDELRQSMQACKIPFIPLELNAEPITKLCVGALMHQEARASIQKDPESFICNVASASPCSVRNGERVEEDIRNHARRLP